MFDEFTDDILEPISAPSGSGGNSRYYGRSRCGVADCFQEEDYSFPDIPHHVREDIERLRRMTDLMEKNVVYGRKGGPLSGFKIDYAAALNEMQLLAATTIDGPVLVIAGAGSGKTRTIVYRTAYLMENNVPPDNILLLTFTKKAAGEMIERAGALLGNSDTRKILGGTFHSFANLLLRKYSSMAGIAPDYTIIDTVDAEDIVDLIKRESGFSRKGVPFPRKNKIYDVISKSRNCGKDIENVITENEELEHLLEFVPEIRVIEKKLREYKKSRNLMDYDDLMEISRNSLRDNPDFLAVIRNRCRYVMVDEYQDTNIIQKEIVDLIAGAHRNIMVVGDDAQSIYSFRGANFENILSLHETYPDCKVIKIEENYRSNQGILDFANSVIENAVLGYKKRLFTNNPGGTRPSVLKFYSPSEEAEFIVSKIKELTHKGVPAYEIAVLYRAGYHGYFIEAELLRGGINYAVYGGIKFMERRHIKDIIAYLRITVNRFDDSAWNRILKLLPGVGNVLASDIIKSIPDSADGRFDFNAFRNKKCYGHLQALGDIIGQVSRPDLTLKEKIEILKEYYFPLLKTLEDDYRIRMKDIEVLSSLAERYDSTPKYLEDLALEPPSNRFTDNTAPMIEEPGRKPLVLSTVHSAKGLEWNTVFVPHLLDGLFPNARALGNIKQIEEERRLFYVACTRAKENLYLTFPSSTNRYAGAFGTTRPSRFLQ